MNTKPKNTALLIATKSTKSNFYNPKKISMMFLESIGCNPSSLIFLLVLLLLRKNFLLFFYNTKQKERKTILKSIEIKHKQNG
tara:strand:- start:277 stop:525 length:249 start_codon:yes stop_codon:yes gene_type:complete